MAPQAQAAPSPAEDLQREEARLQRKDTATPDRAAARCWIEGARSSGPSGSSGAIVSAASHGPRGREAAQRRQGVRHPQRHVTRARPALPAARRTGACSDPPEHFPKDKRGSSYFGASPGQLGSDQKPQAEETRVRRLRVTEGATCRPALCRARPEGSASRSSPRQGRQPPSSPARGPGRAPGARSVPAPPPRPTSAHFPLAPVTPFTAAVPPVRDKPVSEGRTRENLNRWKGSCKYFYLRVL
ncbi:TPA: hypothetical protein BOS_1673 [Bos taurus]|nr:TPA: hypothetical protein BOS_1673 [Bos taurus]